MYVYVETQTVNSIDDVIVNINYTQFNSDHETKFLTDNPTFLKLEVDNIYYNHLVDVGEYENVHLSLFSYDGETLTFHSNLIGYYTNNISELNERYDKCVRAGVLIGIDHMGLLTSAEKTELSSLLTDLDGTYTIQTT